MLIAFMFFLKSNIICFEEIEDEKTYYRFQTETEHHKIEAYNNQFIREQLDRLLSCGISYSNNQDNSLLDYLLSVNCLYEKSPSFKIEPRLSRYYSFLQSKHFKPEEQIQTLANANVWILGLGAIGLAVLRQLVACGVKKFTLIDFDQVEISNLNRIQATRLDLGKDKVDLAAEIVNSYDLSAELNCIKLKINTQDDLSEILKNSDIDLFVLAADQPIFDIAIWSYQECFSRKIPIISGGVNIRYGSWGPFLIPSSQDYELVNERFIKFLNNAKKKLAGCSVPIGSMISTNDIVASFMANDILNFLHDQSVLSLNCLRSIDFDSAKISIQEISS